MAALNIDILSDLDPSELRTLTRVFEKRHVHEHNQGVASPRYVRQIPEDGHLLGQPVPLSMKELEVAAHLLRRVLERLLTAR